MSEKLAKKPETFTDHDPVHAEIADKNLERLKEAAAEAESHDHSLDKIQESIHEHAKRSDEITIDDHVSDREDRHVFGMQRELKLDAYNKSMQKIRSDLKPLERSFSKVVHNKYVEPLSEIGAKTVGRPSGILGSGVVAFTGSGLVLYFAKHYGFRYNFTTFLLLMVCGFAAGVACELFLRLLRRKA